MQNWSHKFTTPSGVLVHVPTDEGREQGVKITEKVLRRWRPPDHFFHFRDGGHVAACRHHLGNTKFARLDIKSFFDSVTRSKIHRALRRLKFRQDDAWSIAQESTVKNAAGQFVLPFGFVQSMVLASVVLDLSQLGRCLRPPHSSVKITVYVDDIVLSGLDEVVIKTVMTELATAAEMSGFAINAGKAQGPAIDIEAFNICLSRDNLRLTDQRMDKFRQAITRNIPNAAGSIIRYVATINGSQADDLAGMRDQLQGPF